MVILYVLPQNYEGPIVVLYGQKDGKPKEYYNNDWRVYRINKDGTLRTQFEYPRSSFINERCCYENREGIGNWLVPIHMDEYVDKWTRNNPPALKRNNIYVYGGLTDIHPCGLTMYYYCGRTRDTIIALLKKHEYPGYKPGKHMDTFISINKIIDSLHYPCK